MLRRKSKSPARSGLTRRGFLKGAGVTAAGAVIAESGLTALAEERAALAAAKGPPVIGPDIGPMTLRVNGVEQALEAEPRTTLAEALRYHLDLTGTKVVCDRGSCSACTVWIDGTPSLSCMTLAIDAQNREIRTIEGLANGDQLHPLQE